MTTEQMALLKAANLELHVAALKFAYQVREGVSTDITERMLSFAAKNLVDTVNAIDPTMWQTPEPCPVDTIYDQ